MVVGSLAVALTEPPPEAVTWLVRVGRGASGATSTVTVMSGYEAPGASASLRVQVLPGVGQVQPVPDIATFVSPTGALSMTVTVPLVGAFPVFETVTV